MRELVYVSIERCLFPEETEITNSQLHVFCDASEDAYAAVVYIFNTYRSGQIIFRLVKASRKLAHKKTFAVPKLELNAALHSSRVTATIKSCSAIREEDFFKILQKGAEFLLKAEFDWPTYLPWLAATADLKHAKQDHIQKVANLSTWSEFCLD